MRRIEKNMVLPGVFDFTHDDREGMAWSSKEEKKMKD